MLDVTRPAGSLAPALVLALLLLAPAWPAHAQGLGLPGPGGCFEDGLEPNTYNTPTVLDRSVTLDLNICASDDWFRLDLKAGQVASIELSLIHANGDIDMSLQRTDFTRVGISESASNREYLRYVAFEDSHLLLRVYGYGGATNDYTLTYTLDDYSSDCPDAAAPPVRVSLDQVVGGRVCLGRGTQYVVAADEDEPFEVAMTSDPGLGDLDLAILDEDGRRVAVSSSTGRWETARVFPADDGDFRVVVSPYGQGFGPISLSVVRLEPRRQPLRIEGSVRFTRLVPTARGLKDHAVVQPEGILVEVLRRLDGQPAARTTTEADGAFHLSLDYGRPEDYFLRVSARLETADYRLEVIPTEGADQAHHLDSQPLSAYPVDDGAVRLDLDLAPDTPMAGALNIATVARGALETVAGVRPRAGLDATFVWSPGQAHACGSCYSDGSILLAGGPGDTDQYDDAVILHELTHYLIDTLSRDDSPGGRHDGSRTTPLVAYGEGMATGLGLVLLGAPFYIDTAGHTVRSFEDMEAVPFLEAYGTTDRSEHGDVSEWTVAGLIWDFVDADSDAEPFDRVSVGRIGLLRVLLGPIVDRRRPDRGTPGLDLADLVDALRCTAPRQSGAIYQLVRGHQQFPIPNWGKDKCQWSGVQ